MSRADDLPPAGRSIWRSLGFAYETEPKQLVSAFAGTLATVAPEVALIVAFRILADSAVDGRSSGVMFACALLASVGVLQWLAQVAAERARMRFADRVTVHLESHVALLQASAVGLEHHERGDYADRLAVLRDQVFALNKVYLSLFSTVAAAARAVLGLLLLASVHPALALLGLLALPPIVVAGRVSAASRRRQEQVASHNRLARSLLVLSTEAGSAKELRVAGTVSAVFRRHVAERAHWYRAVSRARWLSAVAQSVAWAVFGGGFVIALYAVVDAPWSSAGDVIVTLIAGSRIAQYLTELVTEASYFRGDWLGAAQRLVWLEDYGLFGSKRGWASRVGCRRRPAGCVVGSGRRSGTRGPGAGSSR